MTPDTRRVAEARRWYRTVGYAPCSADGVTTVATPAHPDTWDANFACADPGVAGATLLAAIDDRLAHAAWRVAFTDALTDPGQEAALAQAGYTAAGVVIELLAPGALTPRLPLPAISLRPITTAADIAAFEALVALDHAEGRRTASTLASVNAGMLDGMHRRRASLPYYLIVQDGTAVGYGMAAPCPNRLGLIDQLFTHPDARGRGIMSAFIAAAARRLRDEGCDGIFLDAHAADTPRLLYATLGFHPVACTRNWVRHASA